MQNWNQINAEWSQFRGTFWVSVVAFNLIGLLPIPAGLAQGSGAATPTSNNATTRQDAEKLPKQRIIFKLPERGVPPSRVSGGARSLCSTNTPHMPLTAITPLTPKDLNAEVAMISSTPVIFVYIPKTAVEEVEFTLNDLTTNQEVYDTKLKLTKTGGIVKYTLPPEIGSKIQLNHQYGWYFSLLCDPTDTSAVLFVGGGFQRVHPSETFVQKVKITNANDLPLFYATSGYWTEFVDSLTQLRQKHPQDSTISQDWMDLLTAVKLENLADEPLLLNDWYQEIPPK